MRVGLAPIVLLAALPAWSQGIGTTTLNPATAATGSSTPATVTAVITNPGLVAGSVILQRYDSAGRPVAAVGTLHDDGLNGDVTANDQQFTLQFTVYELSPGPITYRVTAAIKGSLTRLLSPPLSVTVTGPSTALAITAPADSTFLNTSPATVRGTVSTSATQVAVNGINAPISGGQFLATVPLLEGRNILTAVAQNSNGTTTTATVQVTLDTTPPRLSIVSPPDQFVTTDLSVAVSGIVNDIVVGTVNDQQVQVLVNGQAAQVSNRSFAVGGVALVTGTNTISVTARDRSGNGSTASVTVLRQAATAPAIRVVSGNNQSGRISTALPAPLVVGVSDGQGKPLANQTVVFKVIGNNGLVNGGPSAAISTNTQGQAQVILTLGSRVGAGSNIVEATATGVLNVVQLVASGLPAAAARINVDSGMGQTGTIGQPLYFPFVAIVTDAGHNRLANVPVTYTVRQGGGTIAGKASVTATSDSDGRVAALLTLGAQEGQDNNVVEATFPGNPGFPAAFTASAKAPGLPANTSISGVVLDNSNVPIPGVTMRLYQLNQGTNNALPVQIGTPVQTNAQGQFLLKPVPVGFFKLMADGFTVSPAGSYPTLEYDIVTVSGRDNTLGMPIYLPKLDPANKLCVSQTTGGTLTLPATPGFSLTVRPGSATFPGGSKSGCISVTPVNGDKVPMSPGFGQQPRFIVTIQPVGTVFNPPAAIAIPNVDGLKPRQVTEMYSYDHDLAAFVAIGTGSVSEDGSVIKSDPGVGVLKAGWHCGGDPNDSGSCCSCSVCQKCTGSNCDADDSQVPPQTPVPCNKQICSGGSVTTVTDPNQEERTCDDKDITTVLDVCKQGTCRGQKISIDITSIWSDQFSGIRANYSPNGAGKESVTYILMAARADGSGYAKARLVVKPDVPEAWGRVVASLVRSGTPVGTAGGSGSDKSLSTELSLVTVDEYFVAAGVDKNSNGVLDANEITVTYPDRLIIVPKWRYVASVVAAQTGQILYTTPDTPIASLLLGAFLSGRAPAGVGTERLVLIGPRELNHNVGASFDSSGILQIPYYVFPPASPIATAIRSSFDFADCVTNTVNAHKSELQAYFATHSEKATFGPWTMITNDAIQDNLKFTIKSPDLFLAYGSTQRLTATMTVVATLFEGNIVVTAVQAQGAVYDTYAWNYERDFPFPDRQLAYIQAGYGTLGESGQVYKTEVRIDGVVPVGLISVPLGTTSSLTGRTAANASRGPSPR